MDEKTPRVLLNTKQQHNKDGLLKTIPPLPPLSPPTDHVLLLGSQTRQNLLYRNHYSNDYRDYLCGFGAAIVNIIVTFPINKIIFRQMLYGHSVRSAFGELRAEGVLNLYRGVGPPLIQRSVTLSLMFGTYGTYRYLLEKYAKDVPLIGEPYGQLCLAAFLAGSTEAFLCPFERIQMLLQVSSIFCLFTSF